MRTELEDLVGVRDWFVGIYAGKGTRKLKHCSDIEDTAVVTQIRYNGAVMTNHAWFTSTRGLYQLRRNKTVVI